VVFYFAKRQLSNVQRGPHKIANAILWGKEQSIAKRSFCLCKNEQKGRVATQDIAVEHALFIWKTALDNVQRGPRKTSKVCFVGRGETDRKAKFWTQAKTSKEGEF